MRETIGQRIRRYREERQLTQQEVGDAVGRSRVAVSKWESGNTKDLKRDSLVGIAKLFGVSLEELLGATSLHSTLTARALLTGKLTDANAAPGPDHEPTAEERAQARIDAEERQREVSERQAGFGRMGGLQKAETNRERDARIARIAAALQDAGHASWATVIAEREGLTATRIREIFRKAKG